MTGIINMTPHDVVLMDVSGQEIRRFPATGAMIRLATNVVPAGEVDGVPLTKTAFGEPEGLPECKTGTFYIVSGLVKSALPSRADLLVPNETVRDEQGKVIGCRSLGI
jgi:hypothetical protein